MRTEQVLILGRDDVRHKVTDINSIGLNDVRYSSKPCLIHSVVLFIDDDGQTKVLKNRYGNEGMVVDNNKSKPTGEVLHQRFLDLFNGCETKKVDPYHVIRYSKNGIWLFEYDLQKKTLWCSQERVWAVFEREYGLTTEEIKNMMKVMVVHHMGFSIENSIPALNSVDQKS